MHVYMNDLLVYIRLCTQPWHSEITNANVRFGHVNKPERMTRCDKKRSTLIASKP